MLLKVETGEDGTTTFKNMHVPHFPEMSLFETLIELPQPNEEDNDNNFSGGEVRVKYNPPDIDSEVEVEVESEVDTRPREPKYLSIPLEPTTTSLKPVTVTMHQSPTTGYNMGSKYNEWFSECFGYPVILAYLGPNTREILGTLAPSKQSGLKSRLRSMKKTGQWQNLFRGFVGEDSIFENWFVRILGTFILISVGVGVFDQDFGTASVLGSTIPTSTTTAILVGTTTLALIGSLYIFWNHFVSSGYEDRITFADCAPYLIISETSVQNVSSRLPPETEMDETKFRPNIVISGAPEAFEEDFWTEIVIGAGSTSQVRLLLTGNCVRCQSLNVDYKTGKMGIGEEGTVLKKLMKDRRVDRGARFSPVFGRYSFLGRGFDGVGVKVGDEVEVVARGEERSTLGEFCPRKDGLLSYIQRFSTFVLAMLTVQIGRVSLIRAR